jgi:hypothetical protein
MQMLHKLAAERRTGLPYPTLERIASGLAPMVAGYYVAKLFGEAEKQHELGLTLAGALTALHSVFQGESWNDLIFGIGIEPLEAAELVDAISILLPAKESEDE